MGLGGEAGGVGEGMSTSSELKVSAGTETLSSTSSGSAVDLPYLAIGIEPVATSFASRRRANPTGFR
jgi:hypothetical protein